MRSKRRNDVTPADNIRLWLVTHADVKRWLGSYATRVPGIATDNADDLDHE